MIYYEMMRVSYLIMLRRNLFHIFIGFGNKFSVIGMSRIQCLFYDLLCSRVYSVGLFCRVFGVFGLIAVVISLLGSSSSITSNYPHLSS